ncbi:DUF5994 family protein [Williamsia deligens]|uniref:DUF5994 family protein n=1 Tax=Williamsia deligens TaxID=321325 RepID=A0ABW3G675_9NOCA|nr:DUF5994 family protein [Williamsia deligens]MCP2193636.1 hypothetical protein [Williamsia deligens]
MTDASAPTEGFIQRVSFRDLETRSKGLHGAWWPADNDLHARLPMLFDALIERVGEVQRVIVHGPDWELGAPRMRRGDRVVRLDSDRRCRSATIKICGPGGTPPVTLMVIPPDTDSATAQRVLVSASEATITVAGLLAQTQ